MPVIRTVHHLAATGGTLIAKCIAAVESVWLASEIDPFADQSIGFAPRQLLGGLDARYGILSEQDLREDFLRQLERALALAARERKHLVIREYTNPAYYSPVLTARLVVLDLLRAEGYTTRSVATVRHPLDSYLALLENVWLLKELRSAEVYSARYLRFLADVRAAELPVFRYEDFVADPDAQLHRIVDALELGFPDGFLERIGSITLTGDSGRSGADIAPRPRRRPARTVLRQVRRELEAPSYLELCDQLGYRPGFDEAPLV